MKVKRVAISDLMEDPDNEREHPEDNLAAIRSSIQRFGQVEPLVVRADQKTVIGGNGRLRVMRELEFEKVDVVEFDGSELRHAGLREEDARSVASTYMDTMARIVDGG